MSKNNTEEVKYDGKPMEHEFDGIKELNNPPPPWLMYMFYITVGISIIYWIYYHVSGAGDLQEAEYLNEMKQAEKDISKNVKTIEIVLLNDEASIAAGEALFTEKGCTACHGKHGEGNAIGPNLTDNYWLHGADVKSVFNVVKNGVPTKGMTPFKGQLSDDKILQLSSFVLLKLKGSNPENPKDPQGVLVN